ncbi:MAG: HdeD family acid-resistance protein [Rhodomicrobium sp.]|nr:HdeD family acid-resistance protein [Rhodomicrobium sp.]
MSSPSVNPEELVGAMRRSLKEHWRIFAVQGILLIILGALAIAVPVVASVAIAAFVGWLLFFAGVFKAVSLIRSPHAPGYISSLVLAILTAILGLVLALFPLQGAITLTMLLTAYFIVHGIASFIFAFSIKADTGRWVLMLLGGVIDLVLAGLVIAGWPSTAVWILGLYVGINLLFTGFALVFAALGARSASA